MVVNSNYVMTAMGMIESLISHRRIWCSTSSFRW